MMNGYRGHYNWHARMRRTLLGPAANHLCVGCGQQALDWSLNAEHCVPGEKWTYVEDVAAYSPRCRSCHLAQDGEFRVLSDDTRDKMSAAQRKRFQEQGVSAETRAKIIKGNAGKVRTPEQRARYSAAAIKREALKSLI